MAQASLDKVVIGRAELVSFVDYDIADIPAKVDTGAFRSSVHADEIKLSDDGKTLSFRLFGGHPIYGVLAKTITTDTFTVVFIANSFGHKEKRYSADLEIKIGSDTFTAAFSLADRRTMVYPVLLGRKVLNDRYVVDSALSGVDRAALKAEYNIEPPQDEEEGHGRTQ